jgi:hypothetical protein
VTEQQIESYRRWVDLETRGEATCRMHLREAADAKLRTKWTLLAELERTTKEALFCYLRANGIAVVESADMRSEGEELAERSASLDWRELMAWLRPRIAYYVDELRAAASVAPVEQQPLALRLREHEEAWLAFVDRELAGDCESSMEPIEAHLAKWRDRGGEQIGGLL